MELSATRLRRPSAAANPQGFCWPLRPPLARQRILPSRSPRYTATSGVDKLKRDRGSEEARHAHLHAANCVAPSRSSSSDVPFRCRIRGSSPLLTAALMSAEPHIRSPFSERLAPQSLILEVIGLGRVGPHCISAYRSHCLRRPARPDPTRLIRPRGTRDNALSPSRMPQTAFTTAPAVSRHG